MIRKSRYGLCSQTVTIYHKDKDGEFTQQTVSGVYYGRTKTQTRTERGDGENTGHLLIIPGATVSIYPGDKVLEGNGDRIATAEEWARFIPSKIPGLCVIRSVHPVYFRGHIVHTEAEG